MHIKLEDYTIESGVHKGEWGVKCYVDGEEFCGYMNEAQCLWAVLVKYFNCEIECIGYTWSPNE